ncbi:MAG: transposase [bacterium]
MRGDYKIYDKQGVYFITSTIIQWIPLFTSKKYFDILISSIKYCQKHKNLEIYVYVILDNHVHMICHGLELSKTIQSIKRHTAKFIIKQLEQDNKTWILNLLRFFKKMHKHDSKHQIWQEGNQPKQIISEKMFKQKTEYIHYNPVKRGIVTEPEHWYFSSARDYNTDQKGPIEVQRLL